MKNKQNKSSNKVDTSNVGATLDNAKKTSMNVGKHLKIKNHDVTYIGARKIDEINNGKFQKKLTKKIISTTFF